MSRRLVLAVCKTSPNGLLRRNGNTNITLLPIRSACLGPSVSVCYTSLLDGYLTHTLHTSVSAVGFGVVVHYSSVALSAYSVAVVVAVAVALSLWR